LRDGDSWSVNVELLLVSHVSKTGRHGAPIGVSLLLSPVPKCEGIFDKVRVGSGAATISAAP